MPHPSVLINYDILIRANEGYERKTYSITFADFMRKALYAPGSGYYTSGETRIGKKGDYTTASEIPAFGRCIARWIQRCHEALGNPQDFTIVELGAGDGLLARTILEHCAKEHDWHPRYVAVEVRPRKEELGVTYLTPQEFKGKFGPHNQLTGVVISNEFFDALTVHRIIQKNGGLQELYVRNAKEYAGNISDDGIGAYWGRYGVELLEGQQAEVNLEAIAWMENIAQIVRRGYMLTIDYGDIVEKLYTPRRSSGTVMGYYRHEPTDALYERIGEQDITAHVNFTALIEYGKGLGLKELSFTTQAEFLLDNGIMDSMPKEDSLQAVNSRQAIKQLLLPGGFGEDFKVLVQEKI